MWWLLVPIPYRVSCLNVKYSIKLKVDRLLFLSSLCNSGKFFITFITRATTSSFGVEWKDSVDRSMEETRCNHWRGWFKTCVRWWGGAGWWLYVQRGNNAAVHFYLSHSFTSLVALIVHFDLFAFWKGEWLFMYWSGLILFVFWFFKFTFCSWIDVVDDMGKSQWIVHQYV